MGKTIQSAALICQLALFCLTTAAPVAQTPVNLGTAGNYVILAQSGITTTGVTAITGHVAVSPAASTTMTGFGLVKSADGTKASSPAVTGDIFAAEYSTPTPATLTAAIGDLTTAYNDAEGRVNPDFVDVGAGNLNGNTLTAGLYKFNTAVTMGGTVTFSGSATDVFIFQISGTLDFGAGSQIVLTGGAQAKNIFYQSAGQVTLGGTSAVKGIILGKTAIVFGSGAKLDTGRALAGTAVTMIGNTITAP